jgi:hypothetical protein
MLLPLNMIRKMQLAKRQKVALAFLFGIGAVIIAIAIVRLYEVSPATTDIDQNVSLIATAPMTLSAWSHIEASVAVIVASLPTFRFLLSRATSRGFLGGEAWGAAGNGAGGQANRDQRSAQTKSNHTIGSADKNGKKKGVKDHNTLGSLAHDDPNELQEVRVVYHPKGAVVRNREKGNEQQQRRPQPRGEGHYKEDSDSKGSEYTEVDELHPTISTSSAPSNPADRAVSASSSKKERGFI